jgi:hypothetical protein
MLVIDSGSHIAYIPRDLQAKFQENVFENIVAKFDIEVSLFSEDHLDNWSQTQLSFLSDNNSSISLTKFDESLLNVSISSIPINGSTLVRFSESCGENELKLDVRKTLSLQFSVEIEQVSLSLIKETRLFQSVKMLSLFVDKVCLTISQSSFSRGNALVSYDESFTVVELSVLDIQIDNFVESSSFPVILYLNKRNPDSNGASKKKLFLILA